MIGGYRVNNKNGVSYHARAYVGGDCFYLGTFDSQNRASMAYKLFIHWRKSGFDVKDIPTANKTKDAI